MAGIMNNTARQYNLKCIGKNGNRVIVRIAPGFNVVDDDHWSAFVPKGGKVDPYVAELKKAGNISFGSKEDDMEMERDPDTKAKSKSEPIAKLKADLEKANAAESKAKAETEKAQAEAETARVELEKAQLELAQLKEASGKKEAKSEKTESKSAK